MEDHRARILIADDEQALRVMFAKRLRRDGHEVIEAGTAIAALELLAANDVDVVVSDIHMPDMDGIDLLKRVHDGYPELPVLLLTGAPELETAMQAVQYGAFEYVTKPVSLDALATSVVRAIVQHRTLVERKRLAESASRPKGSAPSSRGGTRIEPGTVLDGKYRLARVIGAGGMGTVYEAVREDLAHMRVAVKVLHPRLADRSDLVARFRREAEVVAAIQHPNIVKIHDFVAPLEGPSFLVMELLAGQTLATAIDREPRFSPERVAFIASQVLSTLAATHARNIIHRDLKPENVFLTTISGIDDVVKLLDFGIAKLVGDTDHKLTETGMVLGTPAYMAPECARGEKADVQSDIYSVGCLMYEALCGRPPFEGANYNALLYAIQQTNPDPLHEIRPDVSSQLEGVIDRAMARDPDHRYESASEMENDLAPWIMRASGTRRTTDGFGVGFAPTLVASRKERVR